MSKVKVRIRLKGLSPCVACATRHRTFLFMGLYEWTVKDSWDGTPPFTIYNKAKWLPRWREL